MPKINVTQPFKFAENGHRVIEIATGEQTLSKRCAEVALENNWAEKMDPSVENKMAEKPPDNKAGKKSAQKDEKA